MNYQKTPKPSRDKQQSLLETKGLWPFIAAILLTIYSLVSWGYLTNKYSIPTGFGGLIYLFMFPPPVLLCTWVYGLIMQRVLQKFVVPAYVRLFITMGIPAVAIPFVLLNYSPMDGQGNALDYVIMKMSSGN